MVQASLSVAMGQRAPNRAGVTEDVSQRLARREDSSADNNRKDKPIATRDGEGDRERDRSERGGGGGRDWHNDRDRESDRYRDRDRRDLRDNDRHGGGARGEGRYDRDRVTGGGRDRGGPSDNGPRGWGAGDLGRKYNGRDWEDDRGGRPPRPPPANSTVFGRSAADVFGKWAAPVPTEKEVGELDGYGQKPQNDGVKIGRRRR